MNASTDDENELFFDAEEEEEADDANHHENARQTHEHSCRLERRRHNVSKLTQTSGANEFLSAREQLAKLEESEVSDAEAVISVSDPLRLREGDDVDDDEAHGEDCPHDDDGMVVARVILVQQKCSVARVSVMDFHGDGCCSC